MSNDQSGAQAFGQLMLGNWMTQGIYVAAELAIADLLAEGPRTVEELASRTSTHAPSLYRVMRALASIGIFSEDAQHRFSLTPMAQNLRSGTPASQRAFATMAGSEFYQAWGNLLHSVKTGEGGFQHAYRQSFFDYMTQRPDRHAIYDAAMAGVHGRETEPTLDAYDFSQFRTIVDVGGGNGSAIATILRRHPRLRGILFDLPGVADRARAEILASDVASRCEVVGGDFFKCVPGADAYILRHILHDWLDDDSVAILDNCRRAMSPGGRVLVVEFVIPSGNQPCFGKWLDLMMLLVGGRERTEEEYGRLFSRAHLKLNRLFPTSAEVSVVEGISA